MIREIITNYRHKRRRRIEHIYATENGLFWLPCPVCEEYFGGHEQADDDSIPKWVPVPMSSNFQMICPNCTVAGKGIDIDAMVAEREESLRNERPDPHWDLL